MYLHQSLYDILHLGMLALLTRHNDTNILFTLFSRIEMNRFLFSVAGHIQLVMTTTESCLELLLRSHVYQSIMSAVVTQDCQHDRLINMGPDSWLTSRESLSLGDCTATKIKYLCGLHLLWRTLLRGALQKMLFGLKLNSKHIGEHKLVIAEITRSKRYFQFATETSSVQAQGWKFA